MRWYNIVGLGIMVFDILGGYMGLNGIIFKGWTFPQGAALFSVIMVVGIGLTFIDLGFEDHQEFKEEEIEE